MMMKKPEILAPAGNYEALSAAVKAGADAVYLGGNMFSARAFAGNFDTENLLRAIDLCHIFDVKIYLAVNTLFKEEETGLLADYIRPFYKEGIDGAIIQDMGAASLLSREFPDMPLHASTQMSVSSSYGAGFLKELGFTRIVPARELSLAEISSIKENVDIEIETFVHGAMCWCYSGKCLFSSFMGGRSGNRGRCAQPCRKKYEYDGTSEYIMSLKDMCTLEAVPELIKAQIDSFKIEGRMKKPEYVAGTVRAYRKAVDAYFDGAWDPAEIERDADDLRDIYNRGGFCTGYYFKQSGEDMISKKRPNHTGVRAGRVSRIDPPKIYIDLERDINAQDILEIRPSGVELTSGVSEKAGAVLVINGNNFKKIRPGMEVFRTRNNALLDEINENIIGKEIFVRARACVAAKVGRPLEITIEDERCAVSVFGNLVEKAKSRASTEEEVTGKMQKTAGTGLRLEVKCIIDEDAFIPMSELNELRRRAAEEFKTKLAARYFR